MPRAALIQFALVVAIFGAAAPMSQVGLVDATPTWFAFWRALLSTATTAALVGWRGGLAIPVRADVPVVLAVGVCQIGAFFALLHLALTLVPAGRATLLAYTTQFWLVLGAALILAALLVLAVRRALPSPPGSGITGR